MQKAHLHLIRWAVARGYSVAVYGEGEFDGVHSTYKTIKENVEACDMGEMQLVTPSLKEECSSHDFFNKGKWRSVASFSYLFDHGQEPEETISDYYVNEVSEAWASDYDLHCSEVSA